MQLVSRGSRGAVVRELQGNLRAQGYPLQVDGIFGDDTERAVKAFQSARHIRADGVAGPQTFAALHGASANRKVGRDEYNPWDLERWLKSLPPRAPAGSQPTRAVPVPSARSAAVRDANAAASATARPVPDIVSPDENRKYRRLAISGYAGRAWVITDFRKYEGYDIQLLPRHVVQKHGTGPKLKNECAQFVQFFGVPNTRQWRRGPQVCHLAPGDIPVGTVIATLRDGRYYSDYSGRSHVGIYLGHDDYGSWTQSKNAAACVQMMDQWNGTAIGVRRRRYSENGDAVGSVSKKAWVDAAGRKQTHRVSWIKDGEEYFVLMTEN